MIYLKYQYNTAIPNDSSNNVVTEFRELLCTATPVVEGVSGRTLRGRGFRHVRGRYRRYEVSIAPDGILTESDYLYLERYHCADKQWFGFTEGGIVEVSVTLGDMQIEEMNSISEFKLVRFTIETINNSGLPLPGEQPMPTFTNELVS